MKFRLGHVSNSSSSCFLLAKWGACDFSFKEITDILQKMLDFYNDLEEDDLSFDEVFKKPKKATKKDIDLLAGWNVKESEIKGKTLIYSKEDNSIPGLIFSLIEEKFCADRIHLG